MTYPAGCFIFLASFAALTGSFLLTYVLIKHATTFRLIDKPNHRSSHLVPTARGGGLSIVIAFITVSFVFYHFSSENAFIPYVLSLCILIAFTGFYDDLCSSSAFFRFTIQCLLILALLGGLYFLTALNLKQALWIQIVFFTVLFFSGVWAVNLYNFMDGINGFAALETIFVLFAAGITLAYQPSSHDIVYYMCFLGSAVAGFLYWNFPRAHIFMGDTGSLFLGFMICAFAFYTVLLHQINFFSWLIWLAVFWVDATYTLLTRVAYKQVWYQAHCSHLYQCLSRQFQSHTKVVYLFSLYNLCWLLPLGFLVQIKPSLSLFSLALAVFPLLIASVYFKAGVP